MKNNLCILVLYMPSEQIVEDIIEKARKDGKIVLSVFNAISKEDYGKYMSDAMRELARHRVSAIYTNTSVITRENRYEE